MATIEIPDPDFSFSDVIKRKAKDFCAFQLSEGTLKSVAYGYKGNIDNVLEAIESEYHKIRNGSDQVLFVSEVIIHLYQVKQNYTQPRNAISNVGPPRTFTPKQDQNFEDAINEILYFLYNLSSTNGYSFDKNAFDIEDIKNIDAKINSIIVSLEELKAGHEIIYEFVDELKSDLESLKSDIPLGKKRWYQRAAGIVFSYAGTKGADEVYATLKPQLIDLIQQSPSLVDKLLR